MKIRIAGALLPDGKKLEENVETGLMKAGLYEEIERLSLSNLHPGERTRPLPVLYIDDVLISEGIVLSVKEVQEILLGGRINQYKKPQP